MKYDPCLELKKKEHMDDEEKRRCPREGFEASTQNIIGVTIASVFVVGAIVLMLWSWWDNRKIIHRNSPSVYLGGK